MTTSGVKVVPHNPGWKKGFEAEAELVAAALGENVIAIHHIGSTAIPNIYAKPVIDLLVEVGDLAGVDDRRLAMESLGYESKGEFGIVGRRYFRKDNHEGVRTHQLHTFATGSQQIRRHLLFRDYLIAHPDEAKQYSDLKKRLAENHPHSMEAYITGKDGFIKEIDLRAERWNEVNLENRPSLS